MGVFDLEDSYQAHALQYGCLYLYDASYDVDYDGKKLPDNIRYVFQALSVIFWDIRIKAPSSGTGVPLTKRLHPSVKEFMDLVDPLFNLH